MAVVGGRGAQKRRPKARGGGQVFLAHCTLQPLQGTQSQFQSTVCLALHLTPDCRVQSERADEQMDRQPLTVRSQESLKTGGHRGQHTSHLAMIGGPECTFRPNPSDLFDLRCDPLPRMPDGDLLGRRRGALSSWRIGDGDGVSAGWQLLTWATAQRHSSQ